MFHAKLIPVRLANRARLVRPTIPNMRMKIVNIIALLLPNPKQFVDTRFERRATNGQNRQLLRQVVTVDDSDAGSKYPLAVKYGAIVFAFHVPEKWTAVHGNPMTPLPEGWSWWDVTPTYVDADIEEIHERIGMRRYQYSWNVAVDENLSAKDFTVEELEPCGYAWANPMIKLHAHCYKAPFLTAPYQNKTLEPFEKYQTVTEKIPLELVPYGCTNLRLTYFPRANLKDKK